MTIEKLARLQRVDLRDIWKTEARDFTPWLAREENLGLLGDTIGLELELEAQEKSVGPFRADILCKDMSNDSWVLIENQLALTDHRHLGQILTYAAGLKAVTIVWIAERFTDEHQATIEWLNDITQEEINFFGLEIELWQIADSPMAPKFNVVAKPNEWTKAGGAKRRDDSDTSPRKILQKEFWTEFRKYVLSQKTFIKPTKPRPQHWMNIAIGRSKFHLSAIIMVKEEAITVDLWIKGPGRYAHYKLLEDEKEQIESEIGEKLIWYELPDKKSSHIRLLHENIDPKKKTDWKSIQQELLQMLEAMYRTFSERVKKLDAGEYESEQDM